MLNSTLFFIEHIPAFVGVMAQVVSIWGFLNFINQLNLQNATLVADRALGRFPALRIAINSLPNNHIQESIDIVESIFEMYKRLFIDLKQLGIAKKYEKIKIKFTSLVENQNKYAGCEKKTIESEDGSLLVSKIEKNKENILDMLITLENDLMNIFDMSFAGQNFISHLSSNIVKVTWISLIVYLIQINHLIPAGIFFLSGVILLVLFWLFQD
jgi:hypothetical protein